MSIATARLPAIVLLAFAATATAQQPAPGPFVPAPKPAALPLSPTTDAVAPGSEPKAEAVSRIAILDTGFGLTTGRLVSIDAAGVTVATDTGGSRTMSTGDIALVMPEGWWSGARRWPGSIRTPSASATAPSAAAAIELTDSSRYPGTPRPSAADGSVAWDHPLLAKLEFKLDQVRAITIPPPPPSDEPATKTDGDVLILRNGDRVEGFIAGVVHDPEPDGPAAVRVEAKGGAASTVPLARVAVMRLSNPPTSASGVGLWLESGGLTTAASVARVVLGDKLPLTVWMGAPAAAPRDIPSAHLRALAPDLSRVKALARLEIASQKPAAGRSWWRPVKVLGDPAEIAGAAEVEMPGPMTVEWKLGDGASRIGGWLVLPEDSRAWGECEVTLTVVGADGAKPVDIARIKLSDATPMAALNLELPGTGPRLLRATLAEGSRGAVQTRAVFRRTLVLGK